jgi:hypothetical protein
MPGKPVSDIGSSLPMLLFHEGKKCLTSCLELLYCSDCTL